MEKKKFIYFVKKRVEKSFEKKIYLVFSGCFFGFAQAHIAVPDIVVQFKKLFLYVLLRKFLKNVYLVI